MKVGFRKPSLKRSIKARTTGKLKRKMKKAVNPLYGKKGMGLVKNPKKAVYNKVYNKTTVDPLKSLKTKPSKPKKTKSSEVYNNSIGEDIDLYYPTFITDYHKDYYNFIDDWEETLRTPKPTNKHELEARENPGLLGKIFNGIKDKRIERAIERDKKELADWEKEQEIGKKLLSGDLEAYRDYFNERITDIELGQFANELTCNFMDPEHMGITYEFVLSSLPEYYDVDDERQKKYNKSQYFRLEKWAVFGSALRLANETFRILPIQELQIEVTQQGHPILVFTIHKPDIEPIDELNDVDAMEEFLYDLDAQFKHLKTKGFKFIDE